MREPDWQTEDGAIRLYCGDCLDVLPAIEPGSVHLVCDPPYGINENDRKIASRGKLSNPVDYGPVTWDSKPAVAEIALARSISDRQVIFGGNYYELPPTSCWLVWDKLNGENDFADCELAWTNLRQAVRIKRLMWNGMLRAEKGPRVHPTQKPVGVMEWAAGYVPNDKPILDATMGSGTTGVACIRLGRKFIGIEKEPKYFDIAVKRITDELDRLRLFEPKPKIIQRNLLGDDA